MVSAENDSLAKVLRESEIDSEPSIESARESAVGSPHANLATEAQSIWSGGLARAEKAVTENVGGAVVAVAGVALSGALLVARRSPIAIRSQLAIKAGLASEPFEELAGKFARKEMSVEGLAKSVRPSNFINDGGSSAVYSIDDAPQYVLRVSNWKEPAIPWGKLSEAPRVTSDPALGQVIGEVRAGEILRRVPGEPLQLKSDMQSWGKVGEFNLKRLETLNALPQSSFDDFAKSIVTMKRNALAGDWHPGNTLLAGDKLGLVDFTVLPLRSHAARALASLSPAYNPTTDEAFKALTIWPINQGQKTIYGFSVNQGNKYFEPYRQLALKVVSAADKAGLPIKTDTLENLLTKSEIKALTGRR